VPACDGQTDGRTNRQTTTAYTALAWRRAVKTELRPKVYTFQTNNRTQDCCKYKATEQQHEAYLQRSIFIYKIMFSCTNKQQQKVTILHIYISSFNNLQLNYLIALYSDCERL